ncbi:hypothetical protein TNCV_3598831 [Trichonephila clavipes]|nr:hypothetical protein TNCV_3598831 [Trichonephila clavipes]
MSRKQEVRFWCTEFDKGRTDLRDEARAFLEGGIGPPFLHFRPLIKCDFPLFELLKKHLGGQHYRIDVEIPQAVLTWLNNLDIDFYDSSFDGLEYR